MSKVSICKNVKKYFFERLREEGFTKNESISIFKWLCDYEEVDHMCPFLESFLDSIEVFKKMLKILNN